MFDIESIRNDFPILQRQVRGNPLVYLDNAATTQKPRVVIDALVNFYQNQNANIHRGVHTLSQEATDAYEAVRERVRGLINAKSIRSIIFTRNTTEAINLVAYSWGEHHLKTGDRIVLSQLEHHSNLIPWQRLAAKVGAELCFIPVNEEGELETGDLAAIIDSRTRLVAVNHMSNALGTINDVQKIGAAARAQGALFLVDGAQSVPHIPTDVQAINCDFLAFSSHKMVGPTGVGVLYGREELLDVMEPFLGGGDMIKEVWYDHATWSDLPAKFEAGTPNIADVVAFGVAIDYLQGIGLKNILQHEQSMMAYALKEFQKMDNLKIYGPKAPEQRGGILSFNMRGIHPHDIGTILDNEGVAIRAGHHCCQPLMRLYGISGTARASFYLYNTHEEVDILLQAIKKVQEVFARVAS